MSVKKSLFAFAALAAACMAAASSSVFETGIRAWRYAVDRGAWLYSAVLDFFTGALRATSALLATALPGPAVALIAAKLYVLRQVKRDRPRLFSWVMAPST